jgi:hypothetical protein
MAYLEAEKKINPRTGRTKAASAAVRSEKGKGLVKGEK